MTDDKIGSDRLRDPTPLTIEEMKNLLPISTTLGTQFSNRIHLEVAIKTVEAIERLDRAHYRLGVKRQLDYSSGGKYSSHSLADIRHR